MSEPWWIFPRRSYEPELLDDLDFQGKEHEINLIELRTVNRWLGGHRILKSGVKSAIATLTKQTKSTHIADIGCGGGDSLIALAKMARVEGLNLKLTGIDVSLSAVEYARAQCKAYPEIEIRQMDVFGDDFKEFRADIYSFNLVLHHFDNEQVADLLRHCSKKSKIVINDLQRSRFAYALFKLTSFLLGFSYIGKHDGLLSIKKSFSRNDWTKLLANTGINEVNISWRWAFRYLVLI